MTTLSTKMMKASQFVVRNSLWFRVALLSAILFYCIVEFADAMRQKQNAFGSNKWGLVAALMAGPMLLGITAVFILVRRLPTAVAAIAISGYLVYAIFLRGIAAIPSAHGLPIVSLDAVRIWLKATPPNLMALVFAIAQLVNLLKKGGGVFFLSDRAVKGRAWLEANGRQPFVVA